MITHLIKLEEQESKTDMMTKLTPDYWMGLLNESQEKQEWRGFRGRLIPWSGWVKGWVFCVFSLRLTMVYIDREPPAIPPSTSLSWTPVWKRRTCRLSRCALSLLPGSVCLSVCHCVCQCVQVWMCVWMCIYAHSDCCKNICGEAQYWAKARQHGHPK